MSKTQKHILKKYIAQTTKLFPSSYPNKKKIISELKEALHSFCTEHQEFTNEELYNFFGSPQEYANSIIKNINSNELMHSIKMKKSTIFIIVAIVALTIAVTIIAIDKAKDFAVDWANNQYYNSN